MSPSIIVTIGREINAPRTPELEYIYASRALSGKRGVWNLHETEWQAFRRAIRDACLRYGSVVFAGIGRGINTVTGEPGEESACYIVTPPDCVAQLGVRGWQEDSEDFAAILASIGKRYGQIEVGITHGQYKGEPCNA